MQTIHSRLLTSVAALMLPLASQAATFGNTEFNLGGYIKLDAIYSDYKDGDPGGGSLGRDFYIPSLTPTSGNSTTVMDYHARQTRLFIKTSTDLGGHNLSSYLEMDFMVTNDSSANERISNSYNPRLRHAFLKFDNWLFGQTWSTFQDVAALPESVDFIGPTDGVVFVRQAQIRYSHGNFDVALENPETTITPNGGGARIVSDDNTAPDLVARYTHKADWGHLTLAGLLRSLDCDGCDAGGTVDDNITAGGLALTGKYMLGKDDIRFGLYGGSGLGRYVALNALNDAAIDANGDLEAIDSSGGFVAYRHLWNKKLRSTFQYSLFSGDADTNLTGTDVVSSTSRGSINLLYSPVDSFTYGIEYSRANNELESGAEGSMDRLQFMAKYSFGI